MAWPETVNHGEQMCPRERGSGVWVELKARAHSHALRRIVIFVVSFVQRDNFPC